MHVLYGGMDDQLRILVPDGAIVARVFSGKVVDGWTLISLRRSFSRHTTLALRLLRIFVVWARFWWTRK
jgi:hypothetical protein